MFHVNLTPMSTSIEAQVFFDPGDNLPNAVVITCFDQNGNQLQTSGDIPPLNATRLFTRLQPETTYYFQVCLITVDQGGGSYPDCSAWTDYWTMTLPPSTTPPPPNPTITITGTQVFPKLTYWAANLNQWTTRDNGIIVSWASSVPVDTINVEVKSGRISHAENIAVEQWATSGITTPPQPPNGSIFAFPIPGLTYDVTVKGYMASGQWTPPSQPVKVTSPKNIGHVRGFMTWSGVNGSKGTSA